MYSDLSISQARKNTAQELGCGGVICCRFASGMIGQLCDLPVHASQIVIEFAVFCVAGLPHIQCVELLSVIVQRSLSPVSVKSVGCGSIALQL